MTALDRRSLLRLTAAAAALPLLPIPPARAQAAPFSPPAGPMRYARRLERTLVDGARFSVGRSFAVRFVTLAGAYRLEGEQVAVEVDAPESLAALARLERERVERGLFPLLLDVDGAIRGVSAVRGSEQLDAAVREVAARIEQGGHSAAERGQLRAFVDAVHASAGALVTELPRDLFAPAEALREERRAITLPDGQVGEVRLRFTAARDPLTGVMREARREVVTGVAGDERRAVESWTLAPLA